MLRLFLIACISFPFSAATVLADETCRLFLVVATPEMAAEVATIFPDARIGILKQDPSETDRATSVRAWEMRDANYLLFDPCHETFSHALFRERLQTQGVTAVNLRQYLSEKATRPTSPTQPPLSQLTTLLATNSNE